MRLFQAGIYTSNFDVGGRVYSRLTDNEKMMRNSVENHLESYHYIKRQSFVDKIRRDGKKVFLDSGAFSAFSLGSEIDIGSYCDYIKENQDIIEFPSVLDAIGDHVGTWKNQNDMEKRGVCPLPCWHYGEPDEVGQYYSTNYPYITLGGLVPISTPQMILWLDHIWDKYLTDEEGSPIVKVHGFGVTSLPLMLRYPWHSIDSSTWVQWAANGMILLPTSGKQIDISDKSSRRKVAGQHLDSVVPQMRDSLEGEIRTCGGDPDRLRSDYVARWAWNAWAFPEYLKLRKDSWTTKFKRKQPGLF